MERHEYITHAIKNILTIKNIVTIHYFELSKNFDFEGESHNFWEMVYVNKGEIIATVDNEEINLQQGYVSKYTLLFSQIQTNNKHDPK